MIRATWTKRAPLAATAMVLVVGMGLAGCGASYPEIPPPRIEVMGKPPVTETPLIWRPGHWDWTGAAYVWEPGEFVARAGHSDYFQSGRWESTSGGWRWDPAHWLPLS